MDHYQKHINQDLVWSRNRDACSFSFSPIKRDHLLFLYLFLTPSFSFSFTSLSLFCLNLPLLLFPPFPFSLFISVYSLSLSCLSYSRSKSFFSFFRIFSHPSGERRLFACGGCRRKEDTAITQEKEIYDNSIDCVKVGREKKEAKEGKRKRKVESESYRKRKTGRNKGRSKYREIVRNI